MGSPSFNAMRIIIAIAFLLALSECRRHLCDDGTRPICPDRTSAVYNRPTGKNSRKSNYFPPPVCSGVFPPFCLDGSTPRVRFNTCPAEEKKCPKGQGQGPHDRPFHACADGSQCKCPGGGEGCQFHYKRCANGQKCHKGCKSGVPHCPWFTKSRNSHNGIRQYNTGANRPGNKRGGSCSRAYCSKLLVDPTGRIRCDRIIPKDLKWQCCGCTNIRNACKVCQ